MVGLFGFIVFLYFCWNETIGYIGVCYVCNGGPADGMPYI